MIYKKKCGHCGKEFSTVYVSKKFCSTCQYDPGRLRSLSLKSSPVKNKDAFYRLTACWLKTFEREDLERFATMVDEALKQRNI